MLQGLRENQQKKSPKERFLFVIGLLFFVIYLAMGLIIIFWKDFPIALQPSYRIALGIVLILYAFARFFRYYKRN
jgi:uncharacterized membrane protein (DUF485 family)